MAQAASGEDCAIRRVRPSTPAAWEACAICCPSPQAAFPRTLRTPPSPSQVLGTRGPPRRSVQAQLPSPRDCSLAASLQHAGCPGQPGSRALALRGQRGSVLPALAIHPMLHSTSCSTTNMSKTQPSRRHFTGSLMGDASLERSREEQVLVELRNARPGDHKRGDGKHAGPECIGVRCPVRRLGVGAWAPGAPLCS